MPANQVLLVDGTYFDFPSNWTVEQSDEWPRFKAINGTGVKGCDVVGYDGGDELWLIEMKDYTYETTKAPPADLPETVTAKAVGTMGVLHALERSSSESNHVDFARVAAGASRITIALHIQVNNPGQKHKSVPALLASLKSRIRQYAGRLGITRVFVSASPDQQDAVPWKAWRDPETRSRHQVEKPRS